MPRFPAFISRLPLAKKILLATGAALFGGVALISAASIWYQQAHMVDSLTAGGARLGDVILSSVRYSMMLNAREDLAETVKDIGEQKDIFSIRIYNKDGEIMYSGDQAEVGRRTNIRAEACDACHRVDPPLTGLSVQERTRNFHDADGRHMLGVLTPVMNEPGCSGPPCHFHPEDKQVLGALDVVFPLTASEDELMNFQLFILGLAGCVFVGGGLSAHFFLRHFLTRPVGALIEGTRAVARGEKPDLSPVRQEDEIGELAGSISSMSDRIAASQAEINRQRDEYQNLFDQVPCYITVQGPDLRLLRFNREFRERFNPKVGDYCYSAYKGRAEKCLHCAVEQTMQTGRPHCSEESVLLPDGSRAYWLVHTAPIFDESGRAVAVIEMSIDISERRELEERLRHSELNYQAIFNNIASAVFVLDEESLEIIDCNSTALVGYGWSRNDMLGRSFLDLFLPEDRERYASLVKSFTVLNRVRQRERYGKNFYVDIMTSPSDYQGRPVLLVTTHDITERLEAEQKVIQAGKMATLGEMATGVAHELNQPLTVIKTASSFFLRKLRRKEEISPDILGSLAEEIDSHVDRAAKIITHMRNFGRRTTHDTEPVQLNDVLESASEFFLRQFDQRGIKFVWELDANLPRIMATPNMLEQVFTNLLTNARDAIEERAENEPGAPRRITLRSFQENSLVLVQVMDTGTGVPEGLLQRVMEPFFTTKRAGKGTGLGLSISYGIVKDFGGSIIISNKAADDPDGPGAVFTLRFPSTGGGL